MVEIYDRGISALSERIRSGEVSPVEVVDACLARLDAMEATIHAYVTVFRDSARAAAKSAELAIRGGRWRGPLHGIPVAIKDLYDTSGIETTASSLARQRPPAQRDSGVVARLRAAGAIVIGKTQTHEFALGIMTPNSRNPWCASATPGGSSGGSAASVASGSAFIGTGTETGGSIIIPASLCGIVGIKPTFGLVTRSGITSLAWTLDHAGLLARTVPDAAAGLQAIAGYDSGDAGSLALAVPDLMSGLDRGVRGLRVRVPKNYYFERVDPEVESAVRAAYREFESLGAKLVEFRVPMEEYIQAIQFVITLPEAACYHHRALRSNVDKYGADVRALLLTGELIPAASYIQAQRARSVFRSKFRTIFDTVDVIVAPSTAATAVDANSRYIDLGSGNREDVFSAYARLSMPADQNGLPSVSVPCGMSTIGLPIGLQIVGKPLADGTVLSVANAYQGATNWCRQGPPGLVGR